MGPEMLRRRTLLRTFTWIHDGLRREVIDMTRIDRITQSPGSVPARWFFRSPAASWIWLAVRLYVGYQWITAGIEKFQSATWMNGTEFTGFIHGAIAGATGAHPSVQGWYASFLSHVALGAVGFFTYLVPIGEAMVGAFLILGLFTGLSAFAGSFMNLNYMLAGSASTNPILFVLAVFLMLAYRNAGLLGLDRWALPIRRENLPSAPEIPSGRRGAA